MVKHTQAIRRQNNFNVSVEDGTRPRDKKKFFQQMNAKGY